MKDGERIPKKTEGEATAPLVPKPTSATKLCNRCAQWAPPVKNTHNTAQCRKFNADGTRRDGQRNKSLNVHGHDDEILSAFHTMRKEQKALRKQLKKLSVKKKSKKRSYSSDDSSSDSDSD